MLAARAWATLTSLVSAHSSRAFQRAVARLHSLTQVFFVFRRVLHSSLILRLIAVQRGQTVLTFLSRVLRFKHLLRLLSSNSWLLSLCFLVNDGGPRYNNRFKGSLIFVLDILGLCRDRIETHVDLLCRLLNLLGLLRVAWLQVWSCNSILNMRRLLCLHLDSVPILRHFSYQSHLLLFLRNIVCVLHQLFDHDSRVITTLYQAFCVNLASLL